jgi:predicted aconitase with swiveling domain
VINGGKACGVAVVLDQPFSFIGELDPDTGALVLEGHPLNGHVLAGEVLVCPTGKGGTIAPFIAYAAAHRGVGPAAILCDKADPLLCECALVMDVPMLDGFAQSPVASIATGQVVRIVGDEVTVGEDT